MPLVTAVRTSDITYYNLCPDLLTDEHPFNEVTNKFMFWSSLCYRVVCKMDLREVGWDGRDWIDLAQDRDRWRGHVNAVMNLRVL
jgi:hypothetical protein